MEQSIYISLIAPLLYVCHFAYIINSKEFKRFKKINSIICFAMICTSSASLMSGVKIGFAALFMSICFAHIMYQFYKTTFNERIRHFLITESCVMTIIMLAVAVTSIIDMISTNSIFHLDDNREQFTATFIFMMIYLFPLSFYMFRKEYRKWKKKNTILCITMFFTSWIEWITQLNPCIYSFIISYACGHLAYQIAKVEYDDWVGFTDRYIERDFFVCAMISLFAGICGVVFLTSAILDGFIFIR